MIAGYQEFKCNNNFGYSAFVSYGAFWIALGVIFLLNLELGYITPPVGLNLFVASALYEKGLGHVIRSVAPFVGLMLIGLGIMGTAISRNMMVGGLRVVGYDPDAAATVSGGGTVAEPQAATQDPLSPTPDLSEEPGSPG